jgi:hypothetical protein
MKVFNRLRSFLAKFGVSQTATATGKSVAPKVQLVHKPSSIIPPVVAKVTVANQQSPIRRQVSPHQPSTAAGMRRRTSTVVRPDSRPLWQIRGWQKRSEKEYFGAYRTVLGSVVGQAVITDGILMYFILNPPQQLLNGAHGACFHPRNNGWYWVHFSKVPKDLDSGIVSVECLIHEALKK